MKILLANFTRMVDDAGGMAKVTAAFANEMVRRGHEVTLLHSDEKKGDFFFPVDSQVKLCNIKENLDRSIIKMPLYMKVCREISRVLYSRGSKTVNAWFNKSNLLGNIKRYVDEVKPDIIISSQNAATKILLLDLGYKIPLISMSHGPTADYFTDYPKEEIIAIQKADLCQVLINKYAQDLHAKLPNLKVTVIGNGIPQYDFSAELDKEKEQYKIIFVGRLSKNHKRPHLLLKAFSLIAHDYPDWIVELWGEKDNKSYYKELEMLIKSNNLENRVFIKGATNEIPQKLKSADILAFPSAFEGFSLALGEGMSAGLPAVGYKNAPSVNEVIVDGENGFLVEDGIEPYAKALAKLMQDRALRVCMGKNAKQSMIEFAPEAIWDKWEATIEETVHNKK